MMRFYFLVSLLFLSCSAFAANDSLLDQLALTIEKTPEYDAATVKKIDGLKHTLQISDGSPETTFKLYQEIYEQYKSFNFDSAYEYAIKMTQAAKRTGNLSLLNVARLDVSFVLLSGGLYKETYDSLSAISIQGSDSSFKSAYYILWGRYYYDIAQYDFDQYHSASYDIKGNTYLDSGIAFVPRNSFEYYYYIGLREFKKDHLDSAFLFLNKIIDDPRLTYHQVALTASTLSTIYLRKGDENKAIALLARAADADIRSSTKEAVAIFHLAEELYKIGDIRHASIFIDNGIINAQFYDAKQRKLEASTILPLIEAGRINGIESKKNMLIRYSIIVTALMLLLVILSYIILKQVKRLKQAQQALAETHAQQKNINLQLSAANKTLGELNEKLADSNKIKEKYIGYFFNADSDYHIKIEKIKQSIEKKLYDKKYDDINFYLNKIDSRKEKEDLINNFDKLFLALFPNFPAQINALLRPEERIQLKEGELLNTDMRIFALMRMGITDPEKIASILDYSVKTIYTYKSKIKSKSDVPNEEFEEKIMYIKTI
jgi:chaperonin cofactor prefoldin